MKKLVLGDTPKQLNNKLAHVDDAVLVDGMVYTTAKVREMIAENTRLEALLTKHGVCGDCGEMYVHDISAPFASCQCKQSEWYELTPYMKLQQRVQAFGMRFKEFAATQNALTAQLEQAKRDTLALRADGTVLYSAAKQALDFIQQGRELGFIQFSNVAQEEQAKVLRTRLELALEFSPYGREEIG